MFTVSLDSKGYSIKPQGFEVGSISKRVARPFNGTLQEIADKVGRQGYSWCPVIFKDEYRNNDNFLMQELYALDFDKGITYGEVRERCQEYDVGIAFAHETFSSVDGSKFRVVFFGPRLYCVDTAKEYQLGLMRIFPEADIKCKDPARLFFGGKKLIYLKEGL